MKKDNQLGPTLNTLLERRFAYFMSPLESFIHKQTTAGLLLVLFSTAALILANTPWEGILRKTAHTDMGFTLGKWSFSLSLEEWVSQGLMALFFFLTGLEIKREILAGKLKHVQEISLICLAALGGVLIPSLLYYLLNRDGIGQHGWGIPTATDTAFAIGILALMASRVSVGMTVFLTALAIFDDIGSIILISIFYVDHLDMQALTFSAMVLLALFAGNSFGIRRGWFYGILGILLWFFVHKAGIHPTLAGLLLAMAIPARTVISQSGFILNIQKLTSRFERKQNKDVSMLASSGQHSIVSDIGDNVRAASTPLQRWEASLITPIIIIVLPLFALFNAGFVMTKDLFAQGMSSTITLGIMAGLIVGKPLGILAFIYAGIKTGMGRLPKGVTVNEIIGVALLAGIGFTMSIFFTTLSFPREPELLELAKLGILLSSVISAILGILWILLTTNDTKESGVIVDEQET